MLTKLNIHSEEFRKKTSAEMYERVPDEVWYVTYANPVHGRLWMDMKAQLHKQSEDQIASLVRAQIEEIADQIRPGSNIWLPMNQLVENVTGMRWDAN